MRHRPASTDFRALVQRILVTVTATSLASAAACGGHLETVAEGGAGAADAAPTAEDAGPLPADAAPDGARDAGPDAKPPIPPKPDARNCEPYQATDAGSCTVHAIHPCGMPDGAPPPETNPPVETCKLLCEKTGGGWGGCNVKALPGGALDVECAVCVEGRRPAGFMERAPASTDVGGLFAHMAELEAAAVVAFCAMHDELIAHGAPRALVRAAARAAGDERRHTRDAGRIARRFGGAPERQEIARHPTRPLREIAIENAIEGCVRETYGALVAAWQAQNAGDTEIATVMARVADDEARHAELAWDLAAWLSSRLERATRDEVARAHVTALAELRVEVARRVPSELVRVAGMPSRDDALRLVDALEAQLVAPSLAA